MLTEKDITAASGLGRATAAVIAEVLSLNAGRCLIAMISILAACNLFVQAGDQSADERTLFNGDMGNVQCNAWFEVKAGLDSSVKCNDKPSLGLQGGSSDWAGVVIVLSKGEAFSLAQYKTLEFGIQVKGAPSLQICVKNGENEGMKYTPLKKYLEPDGKYPAEGQWATVKIPVSDLVNGKGETMTAFNAIGIQHIGTPAGEIWINDIKLKK